MNDSIIAFLVSTDPSDLKLRFNPVRQEWTATLRWGIVPPNSNVGNVCSAHGTDLSRTLKLLLDRAEGRA